jgi:hypothetical protein
VHVVGGRGLPSSLCNDVEARWTFWDQKENSTNTIKEPTIAPDFNSIEQYQILINHDFVYYVQNESLEVEVWGRPATFIQQKTEKTRNLPTTIPELQNLVKEEREKRKVAEERLAELTGSNSNSRSDSVEAMRIEISTLKKQLAASQRSSTCLIS